MEQIIILILIFALPSIVRRLTQAKRAARPPAGKTPRAAPKPVEPPVGELQEDADSEIEELPAWLRELSSKLGGPPEPETQEAPEADGQISEVYDVSPMESETAPWHEPDAAQPVRADEEPSSTGWRDYLTPGQVPDKRRRARPKTRVARSKTRVRRAAWHRPATNSDWRRAVILKEILGPPIALQQADGEG